MAMSVYTKKGDKGKTSVLGGKRISKNSKVINAIGAIDELNSYLGIIWGLESIQKNLFTINSILAGSDLKLPPNATKKMEIEIDKTEGKLPVLKNFIIYSGTSRAKRLFFARSICRRAERILVCLPNIQKNNPEILKFINRLSDYLFTMARSENYSKKIKELTWNQ